MALKKEEKAKIIKEFAKSANDCGSAEVQIAILTNEMTKAWSGMSIQEYKQLKGLKKENLALINEEIAGIDTIYVRAGEYGALSSSMVFELLKRNKDVSKYIPKYIIDMIKE
mgnify:CR=1 FL=1